MHKYRVRFSRKRPIKPEITMVEIEKESNHCIWINGRRHSKTGSTVRYFDTHEEALSILIKAQEAKTKRLKNALVAAKQNLYYLYNL